MIFFTLPIFKAALPEMVLLFLANGVLLFDVLTTVRLRRLTYWLAQLALVAAFVAAFLQYKEAESALVTFGGHYIFDQLAVLTKMLVLVVSAFAFMYGRDYISERGIAFGEYYLMGLFSVLGMLVMAAAHSLLTIYLGLELLSMPLYAMVAMRKDSQAACEAAMKYFVMGALASGILLYGISILYGITGAITIPEIASVLAHSAGQEQVVLLGMAFILAGLVFKFGAVPFHMWVPDVYQGAPTSVTLFIASAPKIAVLCITFRLLVEALPSVTIQWQQMLIAVAILSMFFGNLLAIAQTNIKRMLAYSSIAHIGYVLLGLIAGPLDPQGYSAAMFYIATYVLVAAGAFAIIAILSKGGIEFDQLRDYQGLNARNPWLAFMMLLLMFSMAGVPPTVGFFAKLGLLEALVHAHYVWLAALALLFAIIGAYYYLRIVKLMYFEEPLPELADSRITVRADLLTVVSVNSAAALLLGLFPSQLIDLCRISFG